MNDNNDKEQEPAVKKLKPLVLISQLAITMLTPILMCLFIGKWLDNRFNAGHIYSLIGILLGILAAYRNAYIMLREYLKNGKKPGDKNKNE